MGGMLEFNEEHDRYHSEGVGELILELLPDGEVCIDVGAYHWGWLSNSYILEENGWRTYCIEPNPNCAPMLAKRAHVYDYAMGEENKDDVNFFIYQMGHGPTGEAGATGLILTGDGAIVQHLTDVVRVNVRTLNWFLETQTNETHVDFLSVDTEGTELDVLRGIDLDKWNVKVVAVEAIYDHHKLEQDIYMNKHGYDLYDRIVFNSIYVRKGIL